MFGIVTDPEMRRRGIGRRLTRGLAATGASMAYLQVEEDNTRALKLYASLGFSEVYT